MSVGISIFSGCAGGYVGAGHVHPALLDAAREAVSEARESGLIRDGFVARCGDDIGLVLLHAESSETVHSLATDALTRARTVGARLAQHGANGDGRLRIDGVVLTLTPRTSEPVLCFLSDKAGPGAWNVHLYRVFADPFNTATLVTGEHASAGFRFVMADDAVFDLPDDLYAFLRAAGSEGRCVARVFSRSTGEQVAAASTGADPMLIVRSEAPFPTVGEALEAFAFPYAVAGWLSGTQVAPLMPVSTNDEASSRSDGPPRVIGLGFQVAPDRFVGPRDLLGDAAFDDARRQALTAADYLRRHGPFSPRGVRGASAPSDRAPQSTA